MSEAVSALMRDVSTLRGVGDARKKALGSLYSEVQAKVNEIFFDEPIDLFRALNDFQVNLFNI